MPVAEPAKMKTTEIILAVIDWLNGVGIGVELAPIYERGRVRVCLILDCPWEGGK